MVAWSVGVRPLVLGLHQLRRELLRLEEAGETTVQGMLHLTGDSTALGQTMKRPLAPIEELV